MSVTVKQRILTNNDCYKSGRTITPNSMQLHTIGTAQNTAESLAQYWNQPGIQACVHYCVDAEKEGLVYQFLPDNRRSWADAGTGNANSITVELMESDFMKYSGGATYTVTNESKFKADVTRAYNTAVEFFAMKCKQYGWNPQEKMANGLHRVYSHDEGRRLGLSSAHVDPTNIWDRYGWTMDKFRADVAKAMKGEAAVATSTLYRVRKSWADEKSQIFAGTLEGAKRAAEANPGYYVYDEAGKLIYGVSDAVSAPSDTTVAKGVPASKEDYIAKVAKIAVELYPQTKILPSVVIGQAFLENGGGVASDAIELTKRNNLFGLKADLINGSWSQYTVWSGESFQKVTPEYYNGKLTYITDSFRVYPDYRTCILDYEMFLTHVQNNAGYKYRSIVGKVDPLEVITTISKGGYATDPAYITKVMNIINQYDLTKYDKQAGVKPSSAPTPTPSTPQYYRVATDYKNGAYVNQKGAYTVKDNAIEAAKSAGSGYKVFSPDGQVVYSAPTKTQKASTAKDIYAVRRALNDEGSQIGLFSVLENAKKLADERWGFNVYNIETRKPVYKPKLLNWQKICASAIKLGEEMLKDLQLGHQWVYAASGEKTFAKARKKQNYKVNCSGGVYWILCDTGIFPDRSILNWYGTYGGFRWLNNHAEADVRKYFDLIYIGNKTVVQCINDGTLRPGDILTYMNISHTNMYLGNNTSFDSGHNNCVGSGNGAKFTRWVSPLTCGSQKIAYIMRVKETAPAPSTQTVQYRVQAGSYLIKDNANNMLAKVKAKGFDAQLVTINGEYVVQLGIFSVRANADALVKKAAEAGIVCLAKKI